MLSQATATRINASVSNIYWGTVILISYIGSWIEKLLKLISLNKLQILGIYFLYIFVHVIHRIHQRPTSSMMITDNFFGPKTPRAGIT